MTANGWIPDRDLCRDRDCAGPPLGGYMTAVFEGRSASCARSSECSTRFAASTSARSSTGLTYGFGMLLFHAIGFVTLYD